MNDQGGPPGHVGNLHEHAARRRAVVRCSDAVLSRHDDQLTIGWDDGAVLAMPMAWCRDIRANLMAEGVGTQIVLRFAPRPPQTGADDDASFVAVRLHTNRESSLQAHEFAEILRRELGLPREPERLGADEPPESPTREPGPSVVSPSGAVDSPCTPSPRVLRAQRSHPDWLVFQPGARTQSLFDAVLRQLALADQSHTAQG